MTTKSKVILGLIGAAAAGVVVGLLLAPEKGSDLRRNITRTAGDWAGQLGDLWANAKDSARNVGRKGASMASDAADRYGNATENF